MNQNHRKILATAESQNFVGRSAETNALCRHVAGKNNSPALLVSSAPASGASELLKQFYDRLFYKPSRTIPIYFAAEKSDASAKNCARRFLQNFVAQTIAFCLQDAKIIERAPNINELTELAAIADAAWVTRLIDIFQTDDQSGGERAFIKKCLSVPLLADADDIAFFVMMDDLHETEYFSGEANFVEEIKETFSRFADPFVLSGNRRFLSKTIRTGDTDLTSAVILPMESLAFHDAGVLAEKLAAKYTVVMDQPARDLIAVKLQGNPTFIRYLIESASEKQMSLDDFRRVEQIYADEVFGGRVRRFYDTIFDEIAPDREIQKEVIELFERARNNENEKILLENWLRSSELNALNQQRTISLLNAREIVRLSSGQVEAMSENDVLSDYLTARYRLEIAFETRASVVGEMLSGFLKRAPQTMAKFYRQQAAIGLRELLETFNGQEIPLALVDYALYQERLKESDFLVDLTAETEKITLPQMIYTAHTAAFYPLFEQVAEKIRSAIAFGFAEKIYTDADETIWMVAEIDSKLEAPIETAEFWCDRFEMVALTCNFTKYKIWLIAPEGFAPDALELLKERNGYGSSRQQVELLIGFLKSGADIIEKTAAAAAEYEIVVPMIADSELIAAAAAEEIARRYHYAPKAINQIKTAVVEACINASEHSLSVERKIYQKISVETDKLIIKIYNRGLRLADRKIEKIVPDENRRGWGLKLIKNLMDEVKFEHVDDGTSISMTKYLNRQANN